ncbi:MAG: tetratricopeptide repeat protein [Gammaproteobacteria bacterium]|nr:tetratricopeptide repeat protein [Gammaproteobacteria bacterium]
MRFWKSAVIALGLLLYIGTAAAETLVEIRDRIDRAVITRDLDALEEAAKQLEKSGADLSAYYLAYTQFRLGTLIGATDKKRAKKHLNRCIDILKPIVKAKPDDAEVVGLQSTCYGSSTAYYMLRAAVRGSNANKFMKQALEIDGENPRVLMLDGISLYARPKALGGNKDKALERFTAAAESFADWSLPTADAPAWGEAENWMYLGRTYLALEQPDKAREHYAKALELEPDFALAREELDALP